MTRTARPGSYVILSLTRQPNDAGGEQYSHNAPDELATIFALSELSDKTKGTCGIALKLILPWN
ncbi:hypothetical protein C8Q77DRAFT_228376 [Trametes polyzona]|nr:hypothetical protein C8Q77DRAFT_228376 [Trametes polyzona]